MPTIPQGGVPHAAMEEMPYMITKSFVDVGDENKWGI